MKTKIFTIFTILSITLCSSCSENKEKDNITLLSEQSVSMNFEEKTQINAESLSPITYTSENEFNATVSNTGLITAGRVGKTQVSLKNDTETKKININVLPKYYIYDEPITKWGKTKNEIIAIKGNPDSDTDEAIGYADLSDNVKFEIYLFNSQGRLHASATIIDIYHVDNLNNFLLERYIPTHVESDDFKALFVNALNDTDITTAVQMSLYSSKLMQILYMDYQSVLGKSSQKSMMPSETKTIQNIVSELLK